MSEAYERDWRMYLDDMVDFAVKVIDYSAGLELSEFLESGMNYDATVRNLELIGEAATHIPGEIRQSHPEIPWRLIIATRNRLIHGYLGIDGNTLWSIIQDKVPDLREKLESMRKAYRG